MKIAKVFISAFIGFTIAHKTVEDPDEHLLNRDHEVATNTLDSTGVKIPEEITDYALLQKFSDEREYTQRGVIKIARHEKTDDILRVAMNETSTPPEDFEKTMQTKCD